MYEPVPYIYTSNIVKKDRAPDTISMNNLGIKLSKSAENHLNQLDSILIVELELYFSCLIRKKVYFHSSPPGHGTRLETGDKRIQVYFRPVMTRLCHTSEVISEPDVVDFPLQRLASFTPHWLSLDTRHGKLVGEYGF